MNTKTKQRRRNAAVSLPVLATTLSKLAKWTYAGELPTPADCKRIRMAASLTLDDLATAMHTSRAAVHYWEKGTKTPSGPSGALYGLVLDDLMTIPAVRDAVTIQRHADGDGA